MLREMHALTLIEKKNPGTMRLAAGARGVWIGLNNVFFSKFINSLQAQ
jgi:hypothetical protein